MAVLLVVLYHAGVPGFTGGFVGVDVFFALSGYLITGILAAEARSRGAIDLPRFYARRARRLLPAATVLLASVAAVGALAYGPLQQVELAKSAVAAAFYASNLLFGSRATDYLAGDSHADPLLHTWSLAVEEQFYVVWPALIAVLLFGAHGFMRVRARAGREGRMRWGLAALALVSLAVALVWMETERAHWAFFSPFARAWEFALGGLAALVPLRAGANEWMRGALGWAGLGAIVASGMLYAEATPFPGVAALLPVVGTVIVLRAGATDTAAATSAQRALGVRWVRWLGRLSYSWYLWHWPVLVVVAALVDELSLPARLALAAASLLPAWLSYRFVEEPVRRSRRLAIRPAYGLALLGAATAASALLAFGWLTLARAQTGVPEQARYAEARADLADLYARGCHDDFDATEPTTCTDEPAGGSAKTVALFGDSHAAQWAPALQRIAERRSWRLVYLTKSSCPGVATSLYQRSLGRVYTECDAWRAAALDTLRVIQPDLVVFTFDVDYPISRDDWASGTAQTVRDLAEVSDAAIVLGDTPRAPFDVPYCLSRRAWHERLSFAAEAQGSAGCSFSPRDVAREASAAIRRKAARAHGIAFLDLTAAICPGDVCLAEDAALVRYRDAHHLTASYAATLADTLARHLDTLNALD